MGIYSSGDFFLVLLLLFLYSFPKTNTSITSLTKFRKVFARAIWALMTIRNNNNKRILNEKITEMKHTQKANNTIIKFIENAIKTEKTTFKCFFPFFFVPYLNPYHSRKDSFRKLFFKYTIDNSCIFGNCLNCHTQSHRRSVREESWQNKKKNPFSLCVYF